MKKNIGFNEKNTTQFVKVFRSLIFCLFVSQMSYPTIGKIGLEKNENKVKINKITRQLQIKLKNEFHE